MNDPFRRSAASAFVINFAMLGAALFALAGWHLWPSSWDNWQAGLLSIFAWLFAVSAAIRALRMIVQRYRHDRALAEFQALGAKPKSSQMVSHDALKKSGMLDA